MTPTQHSEASVESILALPNVQSHLQQSLQWRISNNGEAFGDRTATLLAGPPFLESPIEAIFEIWWDAFVSEFPYLGCGLDLCRQPEITVGRRSYRCDFEVLPADTDVHYHATELFGLTWHNVVIELDGHDYHERTKEQVTYRNRRDRDFLKAGVRVFHFSGSELHANPIATIKEVTDFAWSQWCGIRNSFFAKLSAATR